ncbi:hypothetical protein ACIOD2_17590 [Amycolatopsis sp. NPDC088138]|uniref:hypothetical protein n=1 Tax=Amycolatopsis sp. NPDC088138 TaxID=3363938 RepID=UPI0037FA8841
MDESSQDPAPPVGNAERQEPPRSPAPVPVAILPGAPQHQPHPQQFRQFRTEAPPAAALRPPRRIRDFLPVLLVTLAAVATLSAGFLPLFRTEQTLGSEDAARGVLSYVQTGWSTVFGFPGDDVSSQPSEPLGIALLAAGAVLLAALVFVIRQVVLGRASAAARGVALGATTFLAGVVLATTMAGIPAPVDSGRVRFETSLEAGMWLLFLAVAAAVAATVLNHLAPPGPRPAWADPGAAYADTPTPPSGVAITVLPPEERG